MAHFDPGSREAEATAEMAATRLSRGVAPALVALFLASLAVGPLLEAVAWSHGRSRIVAPLPPQPPSAGWLERARAAIAEIETRFDERSALVRGVRAPTQLALTRATGYGNARVVTGRDGWLFFRDDLEHLLSADRAVGSTGDPVAAITGFREQLARRGIALVVLPVPVKPAIEPGRLAGREVPAPLRRAGETTLFARLQERGIETVDLAPRFARDAAVAPLYLESDTHWRPEAVEIAALELALRLRAGVALPPGDPDRFTEERVTVTGEGDLVRMLDLPEDQRLFPSRPVELRRVAVHGEGAGSAPVLLLGDSFSEIYGGSLWGSGAGLTERLAFHLGLPVDRVSELAGGASASRRKLAAELRLDPARLDGVRVVVLEFVTRELSQGDWREIELPPAPGS